MNLEIIKDNKKKIMLALGVSSALLFGHYYYYNLTSFCSPFFKKQGCPCTTSESKAAGHWAYKDGSTELYCRAD